MNVQKISALTCKLGGYFWDKKRNELILRLSLARVSYITHFLVFFGVKKPSCQTLQSWDRIAFWPSRKWDIQSEFWGTLCHFQWYMLPLITGIWLALLAAHEIFLPALWKDSFWPLLPGDQPRGWRYIAWHDGLSFMLRASKSAWITFGSHSARS